MKHDYKISRFGTIIARIGTSKLQNLSGESSQSLSMGENLITTMDLQHYMPC